MLAVHFKLEPLLRRHNKSVLALAKASGLAKTTVYNIVNDRAKAVELETLGKLVDGLERLTGKTITFDDVLEKKQPQRNALLEELLKDAKPFDWEEMKKHIPDWTPAEKEHNERVWQEIEALKAANLQQESKRLKEVEALFAEPILEEA